jgi:hypothetical protein
MLAFMEQENWNWIGLGWRNGTTPDADFMHEKPGYLQHQAFRPTRSKKDQDGQRARL